MEQLLDDPVERGQASSTATWSRAPWCHRSRRDPGRLRWEERGVVSNQELMSRRGPRDGEEARPELSVRTRSSSTSSSRSRLRAMPSSRSSAPASKRKWRAMQERFDAREIVEARVIDHNKGGLIVDLGVRGFVPISQIVDFPAGRATSSRATPPGDRREAAAVRRANPPAQDPEVNRRGESAHPF